MFNIKGFEHIHQSVPWRSSGSPSSSASPSRAWPRHGRPLPAVVPLAGLLLYGFPLMLSPALPAEGEAPRAGRVADTLSRRAGARCGRAPAAQTGSVIPVCVCMGGGRGR